MRHFKLIILILLLPITSISEYRAFELNIINKTDGTIRKVYSTLDHIQYPQYYPLQKDEVAEYADSWMCWENTEMYKPLCQKPDRNPADQSPK